MATIETTNWAGVEPSTGNPGDNQNITVSAKTCPSRLYRQAKITFTAGEGGTALTRVVYVTQNSEAGDGYQKLATPTIVYFKVNSNMRGVFKITKPTEESQNATYYYLISTGVSESFNETTWTKLNNNDFGAEKTGSTLTNNKTYYLHVATYNGSYSAIRKKSLNVTFKLKTPEGFIVINQEANQIKVKWDATTGFTNGIGIGSGENQINLPISYRLFYTTNTNRTQSDFTSMDSWPSDVSVYNFGSQTYTTPNSGTGGNVTVSGLNSSTTYKFFVVAFERDSNFEADYSNFGVVTGRTTDVPSYNITIAQSEVAVGNEVNIVFKSVANGENYSPIFSVSTSINTNYYEIKYNSQVLSVDSTGAITLPAAVNKSQFTLALKNKNGTNANIQFNVSATTYSGSSILKTTKASTTLLANNSAQGNDTTISILVDGDEYTEGFDWVTTKASGNLEFVLNVQSESSYNIGCTESGTRIGSDTWATINSNSFVDGETYIIDISQNNSNDNRECTFTFKDLLNNSNEFVIKITQASALEFSVSPTNITIGYNISYSTRSPEDITVITPDKWSVGGLVSSAFKAEVKNGSSYTEITQGQYYDPTNSSNKSTVISISSIASPNSHGFVEEANSTFNVYRSNTVWKTVNIHRNVMKFNGSKLLPMVLVLPDGYHTDNGLHNVGETYYTDISKTSIVNEHYADVTGTSIMIVSNTKCKLEIVSGNTGVFAWFDQNHTQTESVYYNPTTGTTVPVYLSLQNLQTGSTNVIRVKSCYDGTQNPQTYADNYINRTDSNFSSNCFYCDLQIRVVEGHYLKIEIRQNTNAEDGNAKNLVVEDFPDYTLDAGASGYYLYINASDTWKMTILNFQDAGQENPFYNHTWVGEQIMQSAEFDADAPDGAYWSGSSGKTLLDISAITTDNQKSFQLGFQLGTTNVSLTDTGFTLTYEKEVVEGEFKITQFELLYSSFEYSSNLEEEDIVHDEEIIKGILNDTSGNLPADVTHFYCGLQFKPNESKDFSRTVWVGAYYPSSYNPLTFSENPTNASASTTRQFTGGNIYYDFGQYENGFVCELPNNSQIPIGFKGKDLPLQLKWFMEKTSNYNGPSYGEIKPVEIDESTTNTLFDLLKKYSVYKRFWQYESGE